MKKIFSTVICLFSVNSFATGTLECLAEDGSKVKAIVQQEGAVPTQVEYSVRGSSYKPANVLQYISNKAFFNGLAQEEQIQTFAVRDTDTGELAVVITNGSLIDKTGTYSVDCSFSH